MMIVLLYLLDAVYHIIHIFIHQPLPDALLRLSISSPNVHCCHRAKIMFLANLLQMFWMTDGVMIGGLLINRSTAATIAVRRGDLLAVLKGVNEISLNTIFRCQRKDQLKLGLGHLQKSSLTGGFKDIAKQIAPW